MEKQCEELGYEVVGHTLVVYLPRELDHHSSQSLKQDTEQIMDETYINKIIFDFTNTSFMDSSGIGAVLGRYKRISTVGGQVGVYGVSPRVDRLLRLAGMYKIITEYQTKEQALKA